MSITVRFAWKMLTCLFDQLKIGQVSIVSMSYIFCTISHRILPGSPVHLQAPNKNKKTYKQPLKSLKTITAARRRFPFMVKLTIYTIPNISIHIPRVGVFVRYFFDLRNIVFFFFVINSFNHVLFVFK